MEKMLPFHPSSLQPPFMPDPDHARRRRADFVLLDKVAYIADRPNGTTALGFTRTGQAVQVSFWLADPPGLSHLCVHCPGLEAHDFAAEPFVVCWEKDIAILYIHFSSSGPNINPVHRGQRQYFVYKADLEHPSLDPLPVPHPLCFGNNEFGLLLATDGFRIAVLRQHPELGTGDYDLHTFSSKTWEWRIQLAQLPPGAKGLPWCHKAQKVIVLDGSTLGFVDLGEGILCCQVDDESPVLPLRHIRLPPPMHVNRGTFCSSVIRDVICIDGVIKFIEIANRKRLVLREQSDDLSHNNGVLHDSDLVELANTPVDDATDVYAYDGWMMVTWSRKTSSDRWLRDCQVDVNDVTVSNPRHLDLLPQLSISSHSGKLMLNKNLIMSAPAFGLQDGDVVFLLCELEIRDKDAWVVAINTREKALKGLATVERTCYFCQTYSPYALSKHMDMAALNHNGRRVKRDDARTVPIGTAIVVHGLDAYVTEDQLVSMFTLFGELSDLRIRDNQQYALVRYVNREHAQEAMSTLDGNYLGRQKLSISWESDTLDKLANANPCNGDEDSYSQSNGYYEMQLKPPKPSYSSSSSVHQNVGGSKKLKLDAGS